MRDSYEFPEKKAESRDSYEFAEAFVVWATD